MCDLTYHQCTMVSGAGMLHAVYYDPNTSRLLHQALAPGHAPEAATVILEASGLVNYLAAACDTRGRVHVVAHCWNATPAKWDLVYAHQDAAGWLSSVVDATVRVAGPTCLVIDAAGFPHLVYSDGPSHELRYATCHQDQWNGEAVGMLATGGAFALSVTPAGQPQVLYLNMQEEVVLAVPSSTCWQDHLVADLFPPGASFTALRDIARQHRTHPRGPALATGATVAAIPPALVPVPAPRPTFAVPGGRDE